MADFSASNLLCLQMISTLVNFGPVRAGAAAGEVLMAVVCTTGTAWFTGVA